MMLREAGTGVYIHNGCTLWRIESGVVAALEILWTVEMDKRIGIMILDSGVSGDVSLRLVVVRQHPVPAIAIDQSPCSNLSLSVRLTVSGDGNSAFPIPAVLHHHSKYSPLSSPSHLTPSHRLKLFGFVSQ